MPGPPPTLQDIRDSEDAFATMTLENCPVNPREKENGGFCTEPNCLSCHSRRHRNLRRDYRRGLAKEEEV